MTIGYAMKHRDDDFTARRPGEQLTRDVRNISHDAIKPKKAERYAQILEIMREYNCGMTAKEIANELMYRGYTKNNDRNNASPRLTEMMESGQVEPIGKKTDKESGKTVTVWGIYNG